jgi:hypothetical protein
VPDNVGVLLLSICNLPVGDVTPIPTLPLPLIVTLCDAAKLS